jgi:hypothetical protein
VGTPEYTDFVAHESFLTSRSEFFRRAMNGNWAESESRVIKLPDDTPEIFAIYLNIVYTGQLVTMRKTKEELASLEAKAFGVELQREYEDVFCLYVLAEKLQDKAVKNAALVAAINISETTHSAKDWRVPELEIVNQVYQSTPEGSSGRRLVIDLYGMLPLVHLMRDFRRATLHEDAFNDLIKVLNETRQKRVGCTGNMVSKNGVKMYLEE